MNVRSLLPGLAACVLLAVCALGLAAIPWVADTLHVGALLLVILLGMLVRAVVPLPDALEPGMRLAQRPLLRWAVAGLGFRVSLQELVSVGGPALLVVVVSTFAALAFGWWLARRLRVGENLGLLLAVGTSICGASAIVAADSVVQAERRDTALALGLITLLGTVGIVIYPVLAHAVGMSDHLYGTWAGASLHEMAQVIAAGAGVSPAAADVATVVKLARIALLAPVVLLLSWFLRRRERAAGAPRVAPVPWFLVLFVAFAAVNSTGWIPAGVLAWIRRVDLWLLCVGMAGVGLETRLRELHGAGVRPLVAGLLQWVFLSGLSFALAVWLLA